MLCLILERCSFESILSLRAAFNGLNRELERTVDEYVEIVLFQRLSAEEIIKMYKMYNRIR